MNFFTLLTVALVVLKLCGVGTYTWFVAFSPLVAGFVIVFSVFAFGVASAVVVAKRRQRSDRHWSW